MITNLDAAAQSLSYLEERWRDESQYESWKTYVTAMTKALPEGAEDVVMTKEPFQVTFTLDGKRQFLRIRGDTIEGGEILHA